jgi:hypothetical protein
MHGHAATTVKYERKWLTCLLSSNAPCREFDDIENRAYITFCDQRPERNGEFYPANKSGKQLRKRRSLTIV